MATEVFTLRAETEIVHKLAALSPYLTGHINRFGGYDLDMEKQPPELLYDLWTHESQILMAQKGRNRCCTPFTII